MLAFIQVRSMRIPEACRGQCKMYVIVRVLQRSQREPGEPGEPGDSVAYVERTLGAHQCLVVGVLVFRNGVRQAEHDGTPKRLGGGFFCERALRTGA